MKILIFQHVPYESPGHILEWIDQKGHSASFVNFYNNTVLPEINSADALVVMGGPMNVYDDEEYSWLPNERDYLKQFIQSGKKVLGVCLGAQLIADALGANVYKNEHIEIGWFKVKVDQDRLPKKLATVFPDEFMTLHWHGDTFDTPENGVNFAYSQATTNQAFYYQNLVGIQFHMEMTAEGVKALLKHNQTIFEEDLPYVHKPGQILNMNDHHEMNRNILFRFLDKFFEK